MTRPSKYLFLEDYHNILSSQNYSIVETPGLVAKWCQKEKVKTSSVALVVCLNIGVDPPGVMKVSPCAKKQCWIDPSGPSTQKALESIGRNLQSQYERLQPRAKYRIALDPTIDLVKKHCQALRKSAKTERVLFHYNGHGVPKPTHNGEIWVFNPQYTQYIPLSIYELHAWVMQPAIYVFDCPSAGTLVESFKSMLEQASNNEVTIGSQPQRRDLLKDIVILSACRPNELLPQDPEFPADLFTACLTTPLRVALRWLLPRSLVHDKRITPDLVDSIPGSASERKTPLGELNWIFTAITDTIAWNVLPRELFQKLFRQDLLVASLFRNFLLAERVMSSVGVMPISYPRLPPTANHQMWQAWDMAAEQVLMQLPVLLLQDPPGVFETTNFFADQLDSFELWLLHGSSDKPPPRQLPIVLQVLLSPVHRLRALDLLHRFLELGSWGVDLALSVGIFPYVLKLLQTTTPELQQTLICIWAKIISLDTSCQHDLVKDNGHLYFVRFLESEAGSLDLKAKAVFVLAVMCDKYPKGQVECLKSGLMGICKDLLSIQVPPEQVLAVWELWRSTCLCIGKMCEGRPEGILRGREISIQLDLRDLLTMRVGAETRAAALYALGSMVMFEPLPDGIQTAPFDELVDWAVDGILVGMYDGSPLVRLETACLLARLALLPAMGAYLQGAGALVQEAAARASQTLYKGAYHSGGGRDHSMFGQEYEQGNKGINWGSMTGTRGVDGLSSVGPHYPASSEYDVYQRLVEGMCLLATDPHPEVSKPGHQALKLIQWELIPIKLHRGHLRHSSSGSQILGASSRTERHRQMSWSDRISEDRDNMHSVNFVNFRDAQTATYFHLLKQEIAPKHSGRLPFKLQRSTDQAPVVVGGTLNQLLRGQAAAGQSIGGQIPVGNMMPSTRIFKISREKTAHSKQESIWSGHEHGQSGYERSWKDIKAKATAVKEHSCPGIHVDSKLDVLGCMLFDPIEPLLAVCGQEGVVKILDYSRKECVSAFHATGETQPHEGYVHVDPVSMVPLNERGLDLMMICSADGSVRVLKGCISETSPKLLTAWQSVPVSIPPTPAQHPATFDWQPATGNLFAAGGKVNGYVFRISLEHQSVLARFMVDSSFPTNVDFIRTFPLQDNLVATGLSNGIVKLFDIRVDSGHVAAWRPFGPPETQSFAGLSVVANQGLGNIAALSQEGWLSVFDARQLDSGAICSVDAHGAGGASALVSHGSLGMMASASLQPSIKVWDANAQQIETPWINEMTSFRIQGPVTCLSFHPREEKIGAGCKGGICSFYDMEAQGRKPSIRDCGLPSELAGLRME